MVETIYRLSLPFLQNCRLSIAYSLKILLVLDYFYLAVFGGLVSNELVNGLGKSLVRTG
jgi:hypothetical protein